jgi:hypothetical protein
LSGNISLKKEKHFLKFFSSKNDISNQSVIFAQQIIKYGTRRSN